MNEFSSFAYDGLPGRVVFGAGSLAQLPEEIERLNTHRALLVVTGSAQRFVPQLTKQLGPRYAASFTEVVQHVPMATVIAAREAMRQSEADCVVTLGGGSAIGLGKAIALETGLPMIAIPTTYSGSEMTPIYGITSEGRKRTGRDLKVLPRTVIYDPALTYSMPPALAASSGMNALAHCVEALYGKTANPITTLMAEEGIRALTQGLPRILEAKTEADKEEGYSQALYGAYLAGAALAVVGTALHHRTCHVLGGSYNLPHGEVNAVILPYAVWYNREATPSAMERLARAMGTKEAAAGLFDFTARIGTPPNLAALGMPKNELENAAQMIVEPPAWNPRPLEYGWVLEMLQAAFRGSFEF